MAFPRSRGDAERYVNYVAGLITESASAEMDVGQKEYMDSVSTDVDRQYADDEQKMKREIDAARKLAQNQAAVAKSLAINAARMEKIKARQAKIALIAEEVKVQAVSLAQDPTFLENLIVQSCLMLLEDKVAVKCKASDKALVQGVFRSAEATYARVIKDSTGKDMKLTIHRSVR